MDERGCVTMTNGALRAAAVPSDVLGPGSPPPVDRAAGAASASLPAEVTAWVVAGRAVLAAVGRADGWHAGTRRLVLAEVDRVERLAAAVRGKVLTAEREAGTWSLGGTGTWPGSSGVSPTRAVARGWRPWVRPGPWPRCPRSPMPSWTVR
jgi:hypothetical protein